MSQAPISQTSACGESDQTLFDWFLGEIGFSPANATPGGTDAGDDAYARAILSEATGRFDQDLLDRLRQDLALADNAAALAWARLARRRKTYPPYELLLTRRDNGKARLGVYPRPLPAHPAGTVRCIASLVRLDRGLAEDRPWPRDQTADPYGVSDDVTTFERWDWDVARDCFVLDPTLAAMLGLSAEESVFAIESWLKRVHPQDRDRVRQKLVAHLSGEDAVFEDEHRLLHKNGKSVWVLSRGKAFYDGDGNICRVSGTCLDISVRKKTEEVVETERRRLFTLLDRLPAFVCLLGPDHSLLFANRHFVELFGEPGARRCYQVMHKRQTPCEICAPFEVFDTRNLSIWEWDMTDKGKIYQIYDYPFQDMDGSSLVLQLGIDMTPSKKAQAALLASEERYRGIADNLALGIVVIAADERLTAANPKMRAWFPELDFDHGPLRHDLFPPAPDDDPDKDPYRATLRQGIVHESEFADALRHFRVAYCPIFERDGVVGSVIAMVEDVTDKLRVQARLQRARKLEALGAMASGIAHEINQPLNALKLYVSGLEMLAEKPAEIERETLLTRLTWIMSQAQKIEDIIIHMRSLVRQESATLSPADLNDAARKALSLLTAQFKAHEVELCLDLSPDLPLVQANPVQLEQVVINLAINAMQALDAMDQAPAGGKRVVVATKPGKERALLRVSDNGPGVKGLEDRIFDPFFTTKEVGKGMGLGLSIVHTLVTSFGGEVSAANNNDGGAVFTVRLRPVAPLSLHPGMG